MRTMVLISLQGNFYRLNPLTLQVPYQSVVSVYIAPPGCEGASAKLQESGICRAGAELGLQA